MTHPLSQSTWPQSGLGPALIELARASDLYNGQSLPSLPLGSQLTAAGVERWLATAAECIGVELEPLDCAYAQLPDVLASLGPGLVRLQLPGGPRYLAVIRSSKRGLEVLLPTGRRAHVPLALVRGVLVRDQEQLPGHAVETTLTIAGVDTRSRERPRDALMKLYLAEARVGDMWLLRADPGSSFVRQLRHAGVWRAAWWTLLTCVGQVGATLCAWWLLGDGAVSGSLSNGLWWAWALLCVTAVPLQVATQHHGARVLRTVALLLKRRLLCGALRLEPDSIRTRGSGRLLAMVFESEAVEAAGLGGVFGGTVGVVQLASAAVLLSLGANATFELLLLAAWVSAFSILATHGYRLRLRWTDQRFALANGFVENVLGHRTRIVQQAPDQWHERDDPAVATYADRSQALDRAARLLQVLPARGFFVLGVCGLAPALVREQADTIDVAVAVAGILQAHWALGSIAASTLPVLSGLVAWRRIAELYHAATLRPRAGDPRVSVQLDAAAASEAPIVDARGLSFRYGPAQRPVLQDCSLSLRHGARVLLEGRSGCGKSTLAALLVGLRAPETGQVLVHGVDRTTLGASAWRRYIASAPQFHENHILSGTLAFNLLLGRSWPARAADLAEAELLCRELGLGDLLDRMPSKLDQVIGETGWQLSHGERSRVFLARAILQNAPVVVLDESFGALDPLTLSQCLETVRRRASALLVIAHP